MWTVAPEQIWKKPRQPGISGFMRLRNEAEFVDRAIASHIDAVDELAIVCNDCTDEAPEICARWQRRYPEKITVAEYAPSIVQWGTPESLSIDPCSPHSLANYYNFALARTNRHIVIKVDGDHLAMSPRFQRICNRVRRDLRPDQRYPIYGLNLTCDNGEIVVYNYYNYSPHPTGNLTQKPGPPPFTGGDHTFYYVDRTSFHKADPVEGFEYIDLSGKRRFPSAHLTYCFLHVKGMKADRGTGNWVQDGTGQRNQRSRWIGQVFAPDPSCLAPVEAMRRHNPMYFRGARIYAELAATFPDVPVRQPAGTDLPALSLRERLADLWYRWGCP
ncbi:MAG: hypothetical protein ACREFU_19245 [Acetobacteraceae bacterium]